MKKKSAFSACFSQSWCDVLMLWLVTLYYTCPRLSDAVTRCYNINNGGGASSLKSAALWPGHEDCRRTSHLLMSGRLYIRLAEWTK